MQGHAIFFRCYPGYIGDGRAQRWMCLRVDGISRDSDDIRLVFDLEFERSPLQAIGDEVSFHTRGFILGAFHLDDERMNFVMLTVVREDVNDGSGIRLNEDLFFEGSLFHTDDYT